MNKKRNIIAIFFCLFVIQLYFHIDAKESFSQNSSMTEFETAKGYFKKGFVFFNKMQYLSAVEFFRKAVSVYPEYYTAREYLARSYKLAGFISEAIKEWEHLAGMTSNNISIINKLDSLQYSASSGIQNKLTIGNYEFVFSGSYNPMNLGRFRFSRPVDIAVDNERNVYITSFSSGKLVKLDSNGDGLAVFDLGADSRFYGVDCSKDMVIVSDFKSDNVHILNTELDPVKSFGKTGSGNSEFHGPEGVAINNNRDLYVVDSGNHRVQKFNREGEYILQFGSPGEYEGQLNNPSFLFLNEKAVYVSDTGNKRIACFDESGNFIRNLNIQQLEIPRGISIYNNSLLIADEKKGLLFHSLDNQEQFWLSSWNNSKNSFSKLLSARVDREGILYCLDYNHESSFVFSPLQKLYSNLDLEITSIDVNKYPVIAFNLNVRERNGKPVYNLKNNNFRITEDSAKIGSLNVDYLRTSEPSISVVLCVDRSSDNMGYHNEIPWISDFILKKMKKNDSIQVLNFNKETWIGNDFDWSRRRTIRELRRRNYSKGKTIDKAIYNAVSNVISKLNKRGVVIISDGSVDSGSFQKYSPEILIEYAKSHYIPVYFIVFKEKNPVLAGIAEQTGGGIYKASELDNLRRIYNRIREAEEYRYVLVYSTHRSAASIKGWWSDVKIEVNDKGHRGVEWGGYFVP
ncbi:MAG: hypothetical protein JW864_05490 [Spirochaetes bacterium]|nr:hypothetical protein [Spirochaetota bacterium]